MEDDLVGNFEAARRLGQPELAEGPPTEAPNELVALCNAKWWGIAHGSPSVIPPARNRLTTREHPNRSGAMVESGADVQLSGEQGPGDSLSAHLTPADRRGEE